MYQEYGAKYEMMIKDATSALENLPEWELHQKGLEAFAFTMEPSPSSDRRKALTIGDLLVKMRIRKIRHCVWTTWKYREESVNASGLCGKLRVIPVPCHSQEYKYHEI
ncbi:hypothetical protein J7337_000626 [Fusarium musae]|uniref:Uncharacterized protein n=1 Tax=Fusarium musae TaxID=1042133 RepID=A0A9P8DRY8_9HYPO|nr:hypothetical protein J7337_000626 [Fusarium musae]KAG9507077.1 hypothetical protein J7337_000626 [Fusarium musae]